MGCSRWGVARVGHGWVTDHTHTPLINSELNLLDKLAATSIAALAASPNTFMISRGFSSLKAHESNLGQLQTFLL